MTSNDHHQYLTVDVFRSELSTFRSEIRSEFKNVHAEILAVRDIALVNSAKIDAHWEAASMWFSIIAILVSVIGVFATLAAIFREFVKAKALTEQKVQDMINYSVSQAVTDAVEKALASWGK